MLKASSKRSGVGLCALPTKPGDARRVADDRPGVFVELHAHEHVAGDPDARDHLALPVLDLDDVLHGDLDLVDLLLDLERRLALLDVGLHLALEAGVGVDDVPLARERAKLGAEGLVGVLVLVVADESVLEDGRIGVAVDIGTVVRLDVVGVGGGALGHLFGDGVVEHLGGGLGLGCFVQVQCVVHDGVRLGVVDVDVFQVGEVLFVGVIHDVQREVLGRLDRVLLGGEHVALLGLVILRGLLCCGRPVGVVDISFRHFVHFRFVGAGIRRHPRRDTGGCYAPAGTPKTMVVNQTNSRSSP